MFGEYLHRIMQAQHITGKKLSESTGICESTISKFISGNQEPRYSQIIQLAKAVILPPEVFISVISSVYDTAPPVINDCCMIREIYKDASSNLRITTLHSFKEFTVDMTNGVYDEAIYVSIILKGGSESELGPHRAGEHRVVKGAKYKGLKVTILKNTIIIMYTLHDIRKDLTNSETRFTFKG